MFKKSLIILSVIFSALFLTTFSFAVNTTDTKDAISNVTNSVVDGVDKLGSDVRNGIGSVENGIEGAVTDTTNDGNNNNGMDNDTFTRTTNDGYTATRTDADLTATTNNGMNSTLWTWIILAILGIVIVGLIWYYGTQTDNHNNM